VTLIGSPVGNNRSDMYYVAAPGFIIE